MSIKIKAPTFPESVADGTIANWVKKEGDNVSQDDVIAEIETDKVVLEVIAQSDGTISKIIKDEGEIVQSAEVIGEFDESGESSKAKERTNDNVEDKKEQVQTKVIENKNYRNNIYNLLNYFPEAVIVIDKAKKLYLVTILLQIGFK